MSRPLRAGAEEYVAMRCALGHQMGNADTLMRFVAWCEARQIETVTTEAALVWASQEGRSSPQWKAQKLSMVRGLARHLAWTDPATQVPPAGLAPGGLFRPVPFIFTDAQVEDLISACRQVRMKPGKPGACAFLIGLLAATGMRISEACGLDVSDIGRADLPHGQAATTLAIRHAKNGSARTIPLHPTTAQAVLRRAADMPAGPEPMPLISVAGNRFKPSALRNHIWPQLLAAAGIDTEPVRPRIHCLRHCFAVKSLVSWYRTGAPDIDARIGWLSAYLGHANPANTYWYLQAVPELMALAAARAAKPWGTEQ
ncbi:MAG: tyrosine-type recombinase/integrase [Bifidobacteriaceae bacterium]|jgi:integrase|nr:tyrosine-type recombinase/integrase [Bifidobacteriaceae bacterium]